MSIMQQFVGKQVVVRADRAGVFFGTLKEVNGSDAILNDCRRLWRWSGAASISQIAVDGTRDPSGCMFTVPVSEIGILGVIEIIPCSEKSITVINGVPAWKC